MHQAESWRGLEGFTIDLAPNEVQEVALSVLLCHTSQPSAGSGYLVNPLPLLKRCLQSMHLSGLSLKALFKTSSGQPRLA